MGFTAMGASSQRAERSPGARSTTTNGGDAFRASHASSRSAGGSERIDRSARSQAEGICANGPSKVRRVEERIISYSAAPTIHLLVFIRLSEAPTPPLICLHEGIGLSYTDFGPLLSVAAPAGGRSSDGVQDNAEAKRRPRDPPARSPDDLRHGLCAAARRGGEQRRRVPVDHAALAPSRAGRAPRHFAAADVDGA